jgi:hypothetical protein
LTLLELKLVSRETAQATLQRLKDGYIDKSGSGYPAALRNNAGCILAQKTTQRVVCSLFSLSFNSYCFLKVFLIKKNI